MNRRVEALRRAAKQSVYEAACTAAIPRISRRAHRRKLLVITYHGLRNRPAPVGTSWSLLPVAEFERQVRYLREHYQIESIDVALDALFAGGLERATACITFDDGYRSNFTLGLPILERYAAPATVYLATGFIGTARLIWSIELDLAFQQSPKQRVDLRPLELGVHRLRNVSQRSQVARAVIARLKPLSPEDRDVSLLHVRDELAVSEPDHDGAYSFLDWSEVGALGQSGLVNFGAHTVNHEIVAHLDDAELSAEIETSIRTVRSRVAAVSATFAYPNGGPGDFDARAAAVLQRVGCTAAVTTIEGFSDSQTDRYRIRRFNVGSDMQLSEFRLLTSGALRRRARV